MGQPQYCTFDYSKTVDVGTLSFRWIFPFWYFCFLLEDKARLALSSKRKQKYQNGNIHRKLRVPTSEREGKLSNPRGRAACARCMNFFFENLRNPAQKRCAETMRWFCRGQKYSTRVAAVPGYSSIPEIQLYLDLLNLVCYSCTRVLNLVHKR